MSAPLAVACANSVAPRRRHRLCARQRRRCDRSGRGAVRRRVPGLGGAPAEGRRRPAPATRPAASPAGTPASTCSPWTSRGPRSSPRRVGATGARRPRCAAGPIGPGWSAGDGDVAPPRRRRAAPLRGADLGQRAVALVPTRPAAPLCQALDTAGDVGRVAGRQRGDPQGRDRGERGAAGGATQDGAELHHGAGAQYEGLVVGSTQCWPARVARYSTPTIRRRSR